VESFIGKSNVFLPLSVRGKGQFTDSYDHVGTHTKQSLIVPKVIEFGTYKLGPYLYFLLFIRFCIKRSLLQIGN
jgi:hypothetical protein